MQTWGSRGDVFPFIALGAGLRRDGHEVTLAVTSDDNEVYSELASESGVKLIKVGRFVEPSPPALNEIVRTRNPVTEIRLINEYFFDPVVDEMYAASKSLCADNDIVIGHFWAHTLLTAATLIKVPRIVVHFCPIGVRSKHTPPAGPNLGPWLNGFIWDIGDYILRKQLFHSADKLRLGEGLPPIRSLQKELFISDDLTLIAASPLLCARPPDWGDNIDICGYLTTPHPESGSGLPDRVRKFIEAGEPPLYFTFGSCHAFFGEDNVRLFLQTVDLINERAIIQTDGRAAFAEHDESKVLFVERADHTRIFPTCKLIVHHGGAGTTQTSMYAGRPSIAVEHGFDQSYWGKKLVDAGVSPQLLHRRSVTPAKLAKAIRQGLQSTEFAHNAKRLGESLAKEDGVENAVDVIGRRFFARGPDQPGPGVSRQPGARGSFEARPIG